MEDNVDKDVEKKAPRRSKTDLSIVDIGAGIFLLVILSLLIGNSYVAYLGENYNERICKASIGLAGRAANEGLDTPHLMTAAFRSWNDCPDPGFFIEHPEFSVFKDEITADLRVITIGTTTKVRFPAQFLILDRSALDKDDEAFPHRTYTCMYQYRLTNPKFTGRVIRGKDGKLMTLPKKQETKPGSQTP